MFPLVTSKYVQDEYGDHGLLNAVEQSLNVMEELNRESQYLEYYRDMLNRNSTCEIYQAEMSSYSASYEYITHHQMYKRWSLSTHVQLVSKSS